MKKTQWLPLFVCTFFLSFVVKANEVDDVKTLVQKWNELHNTRETVVFKELYAPSVLFYGRYKSRQQCVKAKHKFLTPDFQQELISPIAVTHYTSGTIKCSFRKRVTYKQLVKEHDSYLLIQYQDGQYRITGESDTVTDENLGVKLDLGAVISEERKGSSVWTVTGIGLLAIAGAAVYMKRRKQQGRSMECEPQLVHAAEALVVAEPVAQSAGVAVAMMPEATAAIEDEKTGHVPEGLTSKEKGDAFERFVVERFKKEYFRLQEWRSDKYHEGHFALSNMLPDLEFYFQTKRHSVRFAVECKWRAGFRDGQVEWAKSRQLNQYKDYAYRQRIPVFVIIGIGGTPDDPESLYIVPLQSIYSNVLSECQLKKFYRFGKGDFYFNAEAMMLA